jgi:hypothetical protein
MKNVTIRVEREKLVRLFKIGKLVSEKRGICRYCFDLVLQNSKFHLEFFDEDDFILDSAERAYLDGRIVIDDTRVLSVESDVPGVGDNIKILIGLHWSIERGLEILESIKDDIVEMSFKALSDDMDDMMVHSSFRPDELFSAKTESVFV